jgi:hypothetical protein
MGGKLRVRVTLMQAKSAGPLPRKDSRALVVQYSPENKERFHVE